MLMKLTQGGLSIIKFGTVNTKAILLCYLTQCLCLLFSGPGIVKTNCTKAVRKK